MRRFDPWLGRVSGVLAVTGFLLAAGPWVLAYFREASNAERTIIAIGVVLIGIAVALQVRSRVFGSATGALRAANGDVTGFLRGRAARAGGEPPTDRTQDWLRRHHGDASYQSETVALYYELHRSTVLDALDHPRVRKHVTTEQRRFAQQPRSVEDIWATAELLSATNRAIQGIDDPVYDRPYGYEDRKPDA